MVQNRKPTCSVIIVTHNSESVIHRAMECLAQQIVRADQILLVDSGSKDRSYLSRYEQWPEVKIVFAGNDVGFCRGNNEGLKHVPQGTDYLFLVNPVAFLSPTFIEQAIGFMERPVNATCAILTGKVYGYDISKDVPSGRFDTTGIFQRWYGYWYDRGQGEDCHDGLFNKIEEVPAICGALMFCRMRALEDVLLRDREMLDSSFFMYKEDIDLSLRLRALGWRLVYHPQLQAYHCRGWNPDRSKMPRMMRMLSARNELWIHLRTRSVLGILYSAMKYASVVLLNK